MTDISKLANLPESFIFEVEGESKTVGVKCLSVLQIEMVRNKAMGEAKLRWSNRLKDATQALSPDIRNSVICEACKSAPDLSDDMNKIILEDTFIQMVLELAGMNKKELTVIFKEEKNIGEIIKAWQFALNIVDDKAEEVTKESPLV